MGASNYSGPVYSMGVPLPVVGGIPTLGKHRIVDATPTDELRMNELWYPTITLAVAAAQAGDTILIAPGSYVESVTITTSNISLVGCGNRGDVSVVPSVANATAIKVQGTATRTAGVTLINVGAETNGTGIGFHVLGNTRRIRAYGCKFEGGTDAMKLESDATGSVGDTRFVDCEICWATNGVHLTASGGGDPVTQTLFQGCLLHNLVTDCIKNVTVHSTNLWIDSNIFDNQEDGTQPTQFLDIAVASTTGYVTNNVFATTVFSTAKFGIATGVLFSNNISQAENPSAAVGGTAGRPD
jgi:hypothetical protein